MGKRILFDCRSTEYKSPFGVLTPGELCTLRIRIPAACGTTLVELCLQCDRTGDVRYVPFDREGDREDYECFACTFSAKQPDLFFYWFRITTVGGQFRLFRQGDGDTNMEAGELWQLTCADPAFPPPEWARGAVMYQILPDRFFRAGECDCSEKLQPYTLHPTTEEQPQWRPDAAGEVLNNDFFGGNLAGITEKLPYLEDLGVEILYLNPVFMAFSNHRYDTCDYHRIDPMLGTEADLRRLCGEAHSRGMRVILDGVFSHTGSRSVYFDRENEFGGGAFHDPDSPYRSWYRFRSWPEDYLCWWDFKTLPCLEKNDPAYRAFLYEGENSVVDHWLNCGVDGFRLDVADELPDDFILGLRRKMRARKPDSLLLGEVWEDASNKIAYSVRRRYFADGELDGVMNYPWRTAILAFCRGEDDGGELCRQVETLLEHYPGGVMDCTMNLLSSHDVARALTELAAPFSGTRDAMAAHRLTPEQRAEGLRRLRMAAVLQFALPGMPCIYYGDEAGMEGCKDPFNRGCYPWGGEELALRGFYRTLGQLRKHTPALRRGATEITSDGTGRITILRRWQEERLEIIVDRAQNCWLLNGERQKWE